MNIRTRAVRLAGTVAILLLCLTALSRAGADEADLKSQWWRDGTIADLKSMEAGDIKRIQICRIEWPKRVIAPSKKEEYAEKKYATRPLSHEEDTQEISGLLKLIREAEPFKESGRHERSTPDCVLVVEPVKGKPFEILFSTQLDEPLGEVYSLELKEALYALAGKSTRFSIICFDKGEVQRVIHHWAIAPHTGGVSSQTTDAEMHLTSEKGLTLYVKVRDGEDVLMEDEKPMHYGEAKVFESSGKGSYIVLLQEP